jgi:thioredoxin reductase
MPAHQVLGMVRRKAALVSPTDCIGHGACKAVCPAGAISLVFGTAERGVDIPYVKPNFETNVPRLFIAGELGGMGLIRNAIEQGRQAMDAVATAIKGVRGDVLDVVVVGAGPSGISASLAAKKRGMKYLTIEQDSLGGTVAHFPRRKLVMTSPAELPIVGKMKFRETTKEALIDFWQGIEKKVGLEISYGERMTGLASNGQLYRVKTTRAEHVAKAVLLAIGRRGTPRQLGVPGEDLAKVAYRLIDPAQYAGQKVLIVGGGDSAIESAITIGAESGAHVTLSYRSAAFSRAKRKNREGLEAAEKAGTVTVMLESNVVEIRPSSVVLSHRGKDIEIENDAVIINAGGVLPTVLLKELGVTVETKYGES